MNYISLPKRPLISVHVLHDCRRQLREHRRSWFDHGFKPGKAHEKMARQLLPVLHLSTRKENQLNLQRLLANLLAVEDRWSSLLVPMHPTDWTRNRYRRTTRGMPGIINRMHEAGYVDKKVMGRHAKQVTRIWSTPRLLRSCSSLPPPAYDPVELVILKDANGRLQDYGETEYTRTLRRQLKGLNRINGRAVIRFKRYRVQTQLHAVYKQDFTQGGGLYTSGSVHVQGLKGSERSRLTINGEPVVELDYSGYHPCLLYAAEGIQFEGDPYDLGTVTEDPIARKFAKTALHSLLNAASWRKAEKAVNHWAFQHPDAVPTLKRLGLYPARQVLGHLERRHQPIRHHFSGSGLRLMNLGAKIALGVVRHFTDQGTPCLPVHDSFLVQERYESELHQAMLNTYKQCSNGFKILITKK